MRRVTLTVVAAVVLLVSFAADRARAQYSQFYGPAYRPAGDFGSYGRGGPALSPYLNLTRGGNPAANYFLGVLPEISNRATRAEVGTMINDLNRRIEAPLPATLPGDEVLAQLTGGGLPPTGHPAGFAIYGSYYGLQAPSMPANRASPAQVRGR
jgi:hypothetical protein